MHLSKVQYGKEFPNSRAIIVPTQRPSYGLMEHTYSPVPGRHSVAGALFGVTEADIRTVRDSPLMDAYQIELWNGRVFHFTGVEMVQGKLDAIDQNIDWTPLFPRRRWWAWWRNAK